MNYSRCKSCAECFHYRASKSNNQFLIIEMRWRSRRPGSETIFYYYDTYWQNRCSSCKNKSETNTRRMAWDWGRRKALDFDFSRPKYEQENHLHPQGDKNKSNRLIYTLTECNVFSCRVRQAAYGHLATIILARDARRWADEIASVTEASKKKCKISWHRRSAGNSKRECNYIVDCARPYE